VNVADIGFFLLTGMFAGTMAGMMGIGGGIIYVPLLMWFMETHQFPAEHIPLFAVSTSLSIIVTSILSGAYKHWKNGNLSLPALPYLVLGGSVAAVVSSLGLTRLDVGQFKLVMGIFFFLVGSKLIRGAGNQNVEGNTEVQMSSPSRFVVIGLASGGISSFFGVGGGVVTVPLLHFFTKFKMSKAIGTSSGFMIFVTTVSLCSYLYQSASIAVLPPAFLGSIYLSAYLAIIPTAFIFNGVGANLANNVDGAKLKRLFGFFLILVAFYHWINFFLSLK